MKTLLTGGRVWLEEHTFAENCDILIENNTIVAMGDACKGMTADQVVPMQGMTLLPGLLDGHTHGRIGYDFDSATVEQMKEMKLDYARHGVTAVFATLASATVEQWLTSIHNMEQSGYEGIHLEGRYLNVKKKGAHAEHLLAPLDANELEHILQSVHLPCHISAALELDADGSFSKKALEHGATLGLGHTCATAAEAKRALQNGAISFTHLYNAMPPLHHREGGAVSVALTSENCYGELIVDGMHVCGDMVKLAYRCLGKDRLVLISDSMSATCCADGEYAIAGQPVVVTNGKATLHDGTLAGSTLNLFDGMRNLMKFADVPLADAVACATINPARMLGVDQTLGSIAVGKRADILVVDDRVELKKVLTNGMWLEA